MKIVQDVLEWAKAPVGDKKNGGHLPFKKFVLKWKKKIGFYLEEDMEIERDTLY